MGYLWILWCSRTFGSFRKHPLLPSTHSPGREGQWRVRPSQLAACHAEGWRSLMRGVDKPLFVVDFMMFPGAIVHFHDWREGRSQSSHRFAAELTCNCGLIPEIWVFVGFSGAKIKSSIRSGIMWSQVSEFKEVPSQASSSKLKQVSEGGALPFSAPTTEAGSLFPEN